MTLESHAALVKEQLERARQEGSLGSEITAARIQKWFEEQHGMSWAEYVRQKEPPRVQQR